MLKRQSVGAIVLVVGLLGGASWLFADKTGPYDTVVVRRGDIEATVNAIGTLRPRLQVEVGARVSGQIDRLYVKPGDSVEKGQLLAEIDPRIAQAAVSAGKAELTNLKARLTEHYAQLELAAQQQARQQQMLEEGSTRLEDVQLAIAAYKMAAARIAQLKAQIEQTQSSLSGDEALLDYTRIHAPMAGTVVSVEAREGQTLNATYQTPDILRIADLSAMTVWAEVSEADVRRVKPGMPVYFTTLGSHGDAAPRRWEGTVRQVLPAPPVTASQSGNNSAAPAATKAVAYTVLFDVDNADGELMPQMTAQVTFITARARQVIAVPLAALTATAQPGTSERYTARALSPDDEAETRKLHVGVRSRHQVEVIDGLREGERLVIGERVSDGRMRWLQW